MKEKQHDWLLELSNNPQMYVADFDAVGVNASNTSFQSEATYKKYEDIRNMEQFLTDGKFDDAKFHQFYVRAASAYNQLANKQFTKDVTQMIQFTPDNLWVDIDKRSTPKVDIFKTLNPDRDLTGVITLGITHRGQFTPMELAETQKVWDGKTGTWKSAPNDAFFEDFFQTKVMAQWDDEGDHIDLSTGRKMHHLKGDYKLNENGTYYAELLNGRDVYGRQVIHKLDTLTRDGSAWNALDFMDSDDRQKSAVGTLLRNVVEYAPMFIPGIGEWYIGARVALQSAKMIANLSKLVTGSDAPTANNVIGFVDSLEPGTSLHSQLHTWTMENILNMAGEVIGQLAEQRWVFKYAPSVFGNRIGALDEAERAAMSEKIAADFIEKNSALVGAEAKTWNGITKQLDLKSIGMWKALAEMGKAMEQYNNIGKYLGRAYMTALTVQDTYSEAKAQGLTDTEAALLTLGYAAGEWALLSTDLGEWILPELKGEQARMRGIITSQFQGWRQEAQEATSKAAKANVFLKIFNYGKKLVYRDLEAGTLFSHAAGESFEEVSEELLADVSKSIFNVVSDLRGSDHKVEAWLNMADRYTMSAIGGFLGGGVGQFLPGFRDANAALSKNLTRDQGFQQLVWDIRHGKAQEYMKMADKMTLADKNLSYKKDVILGEDGKPINLMGDENDNLNVLAHQQFNTLIQQLESAINSEEGSLTDNSVINVLKSQADRTDALRYLRTWRIAGTNNDPGSLTAAGYLLDYNDIMTHIAETKLKIAQQSGQIGTDSLKRAAELNANSDQGSDLLGILQLELKFWLDRRDELLGPDSAKDFAKKLIFELSGLSRLLTHKSPTSALSLPMFIKARAGKDMDKCSLAEVNYYAAEWKRLLQSQGKDKIDNAYLIWELLSQKHTPYLNQLLNQYFNPEAVETDKLFHKQLLDLMQMNSADQLFLSLYEQIEKATVTQRDPLMAEDGITLQTNEQGEPLYTQYQVWSPELFVQNVQLTLGEGVDVRGSFIMLLLKEDSTWYDGILSDVKSFYDDALELNAKHDKKEIDDDTYNQEVKNLTSRKASITDTLRHSIMRYGIEQLENVVNGYIDQGFINPDVKAYLSTVIDSVAQLLEDYGDQYDMNEWLDLTSQFFNYLIDSSDMNFAYGDDEGAPMVWAERIKDALPELSSPIYLMLDQEAMFMAQSSEGEQKAPTAYTKESITKLMLDLREQLYDNIERIDAFEFDKSTLDRIEYAKEVVQMLVPQVMATLSNTLDVSNPFIVNAYINKIDPEAGLAEMEEGTVNAIVQDAKNVLTLLEFYQRLNDLNSDYKLGEISKLGPRMYLLYYSGLRPIVEVLPLEEQDKQELLAAFENASTLQSLIDNEVKSDDDTLTNAENEITAIYDKIYDIFHKDKYKDILNSVEGMKKIFNVDNFNLLGDGNPSDPTKIGLSTTSLDPHTVMYKLIAAMAFKQSSAKAKALAAKIEGIAPLITHEDVVTSAYSMIMNGKVLENAIKAYKQSVIEKLEEDAGFLAKFGNIKTPDHINLPSFLRAFLVEGAPGVGKTASIIRTVVKMLENSDKPELANKIWFVHMTENKAKKLAKDSGKEGAIALSHRQLVDKIMPDLQLKLTDNGGEISKPVRDESTNKVTDVTDSLIKYIDTDADGTILKSFEYDADIAQMGNDQPWLIVVDEAFLMNQLEMKALDRFARQGETSILALGDSQQNKAYVQGYAKDPSGLISHLEWQLLRGEFATTHKMATSMRDANNALKNSIKMIQAAMPGIKSTLMSSANKIPFTTVYGLDGNKHYGIQAIGRNASGDVTALRAIVADLVANLNGDEKIGFIQGNGTNSPLATMMHNEFGDKVQFYNLEDAQGDEADYYVYETPNNDNMDGVKANKMLDAAYTAVTRAKLYALVVYDRNGNLPVDFKSSQSPDIHVSPLTGQAIQSYTTKRDAILEKLAFLDGKFPYISKLGQQLVAPAPQPLGNPVMESLPEVYLPEVNDDGTATGEESLIPDGGLSSRIDQRSRIRADLVDAEQPLKLAIVNGSTTPTLNSILSTFANATNGYVVVYDSNDPTKIIRMEKPAVRSMRIDGLHGMENVAPYSQYLPGWINVLNSSTATDDLKQLVIKNMSDTFFSLLNALWYAKSDADVVQQIRDYLGVQSAPIDWLFGLVSRDVTNSNNTLARFKRQTTPMAALGNKVESPLYIYANDENSDKILSKLIVITARIGNQLMEIPYATLPNPYTMMKNPSFLHIEQYVNGLPPTLRGKLRNDNVMNWLRAEIQAGRNVQANQAMLDVMDVYTWTGNNYVPLSNNTKQALFNLEVGNVAIKGSDLGVYYVDDPHRKWDGEWVSLESLRQNPRMAISKIYIAKNNTYNNKPFAKKGYPYVLVTSDPRFKGSDLAMLDQYKRLVMAAPPGTLPTGPVKLLYVAHPEGTLLEYIHQLVNPLSVQYTRRLGNYLTPYKLLRLMKTNPVLWQHAEEVFNNKEDINRIIDQLNDIEHRANLNSFTDLVQRNNMRLNTTREQARVLNEETRGKKNLHVLREALIALMYNQVASTGDYDVRLDLLLVNEVLQMLTDNNIPILYDLKTKAVTGVQDANAMEADIDNAWITNLKAYGKIDTPQLTGNIAPVYQEALLAKRNGRNINGYIKGPDTDAYSTDTDGSKLFAPQGPTPKQLIIESLYSTPTTEISNILNALPDNVTRQQAIDALRLNGYLASYYFGTLHIGRLVSPNPPAGFDITQINQDELFRILADPNTNHNEIPVSLGSATYIAQWDALNDRLYLQEQASGQAGAQPVVDTSLLSDLAVLDALQTYDVLDDFSDLEQAYSLLLDDGKIGELEVYAEDEDLDEEVREKLHQLVEQLRLLPEEPACNPITIQF